MVARGGGDGMDIGSERCLARDRKAVCAKDSDDDVTSLGSAARFFQMIAPYRASPLTCRPAASNCIISQARLRSPFRLVS